MKVIGSSSKLTAGLVVGLAVGVVGLGGGAAVGAATFDANNARKVDNKMAVGAGASTTARAGKLVATYPSGAFKGQLPPAAVPRFESFATATGTDAQVVTGGASTPLPGASTTITLARPGIITAFFGAESACYGGGTSAWCGIDVKVDGVLMDGESDDAFDSTDNGAETSSSWEAHSVTRTKAVSAGTHTVTVSTNGFSSPSFRLDDWNLVVEGHM